MKPIDFPQSTKVLQRPSTMAESECQSLHVWNDGKQCVSCWKPSLIERLKIAFGGKVWLGVMSGKTQPPVFVSGERVFNKTSKLAFFRAFITKAKESIVNVCKNVENGFKQPDKRKHFIVGFVTSLTIGVFAPWIALLFACGLGAAKEWYDSRGHGTVELMDFVFTCLGAICALPLTLIIHAIIW